MRLNCFSFFIAILFFTLSPIIPSFSQFKDFRKAVVIKSNGDSIAGKVSYKIDFSKHEKILFRKSKLKQEFPVSELRKIIFSTGEVYTVIESQDSTHRKKLAKTYIEGIIGLYKIADMHYIKTDSSIFELDDRIVTYERDGKEIRAPSKKFLSALNIAFMACQTLNYKPLANRVRLKPLTNLIYQYGRCRNIQIEKVARPIIELGLSAGPSGQTLNSSFIEGPSYNSGKGFSYGLSFLRDVGLSGRLKTRLDLNYLKSDISGAFTASYIDIHGPKNEYVSFSTSFRGLRIPLGMQYHFYNNASSLYITGGISFEINRYNDFNTSGYYIYDKSGIKTYEPSFQDQFEVKRAIFSGLWGAIGSDIRLNNKLKLNIELKGIRTTFDVYGVGSGRNGYVIQTEKVSINEFVPTMCMKYRIR